TKVHKHPKAQRFNDFRRMFDKLGKEIDAVTISTPDHTHAVATMMAIKMGNQGTCTTRLREGVEAIQAGAIGNVREVHVWTNRPIWPQSPLIRSRPPEAPVPSYLNWDEWLGTAPVRPYAEKFYHSFNWRGWRDLGTGALGDMGCHTTNLPFMTLRLGHPISLLAQSEEL